MLRHILTTSALVTVALVAACDTMPERNAMLEDARSVYDSALSDPMVQQNAPTELDQAKSAFTEADRAWRQSETPSDVDHLAYLAKRKSEIAMRTARLKADELAIQSASVERDRLRLEARTREADRKAAEAQAAERRAQAMQQSAASAQQQAQEQAARADSLEQQLKELEAKQTERGLVVTLGDVLFDPGRAELKPGAVRTVQKLAEVLNSKPQRRIMIEGFTDSVGGETYNLQLSERRADAVRAELVVAGVAPERIATRGYGKEFPVASNGTPVGRQLNRRVEVVFSDDSGNIAPRASAR